MPDPQWSASWRAGSTDQILHALACLWAHFDSRADQLSQEIATMSQSLSDQFAAAVAAINADIDAVSAEVTQLLAGVIPGDPLTQAQVDSLTAIDARLKAIPPLGQVTPPADQTIPTV